MPPRILSLPRQPGETMYQYRNRRSIEIYGMTIYQRRIASAEARGMSRTSARGHVQGESTLRQYRFARANPTETRPYYIVYRDDLRLWLENNGYTPDTTGMTWTDLMRLGPRLRWMVDNTSPGGRVTPEMIADAVQLEQDGELPSGWAAERLWRKYDDMVAYRDYGDKASGRESWADYQATSEYIPSVAPQWWYYR